MKKPIGPLLAIPVRTQATIDEHSMIRSAGDVFIRAFARAFESHGVYWPTFGGPVLFDETDRRYLRTGFDFDLGIMIGDLMDGDEALGVKVKFMRDLGEVLRKYAPEAADSLLSYDGKVK